MAVSGLKVFKQLVFVMQISVLQDRWKITGYYVPFKEEMQCALYKESVRTAL
jgi:hypothetical protein